jgi:ABC-2 type transport system permease protein
MTLFKQQVKAEWLTLLVWSLIIYGLLFALVVLGDQMYQSGALNRMAEAVKGMPEPLRSLYIADASVTTVEGWVRAFCWGGWLVIPFLVYTALLVAGMITREMDRHTMEFLLSLPIARWQVVLSRWIGLALATAVLQAAHFLGVVTGVAAVGGTMDLGRWLVADLNGWLLVLAVGSILLALSILIDDYGRGVGAILGVALGLYFFQAAAEQAGGIMKSVRDVLPLAFYNPWPIVSQRVTPWGDMVVLTGMTLAALALAIWLFQRKQVTV